MTFKIGIVGAENSHASKIGQVCNVDKKVPARAVAIWGETAAFAKAAAEAAQIPTIVRDWKEMLGQVDGVMIDHRHPLPHYEVAKFFLEHKVPVFVDKPFTYTLRHAKALIALADKNDTPLTCFSVVPMQQSFIAFQKEAKKLGKLHLVNFRGPADLYSKYGGVFFYGIHQVDAMIELLGTQVDRVQLVRNGKSGVAIVNYIDGPQVTLNLQADGFKGGFTVSAAGDAQVIHQDLKFDANPYLTGAKTFVKMFRTGKEPYDASRLLAPVAVLEAIAKSLKTGGSVRVARV